MPCLNNDCGPRREGERLTPQDHSTTQIQSHGLNLFSVTYFWGQRHGVVGQIYDKESGGWTDVDSSSSNLRSRHEFLPFPDLAAGPDLNLGLVLGQSRRPRSRFELEVPPDSLMATVDRIVDKLKKAEEANKQAWNELYDCIWNSPEGQEFTRKVRAVPAFKPPIRLAVTTGAYSSYRYYKGIKPTFSVVAAARGFVFYLLLENVRVTGEINSIPRDAIRARTNECEQQIQQKYGFMPKPPPYPSRKFR